ncbi:uncharacterized protein ACLA_017110 [Aspergillus clavatus NRRL 1]|uniref:Uncharacterized protein n=1 Tax=Aspergillus clavatus (strain ATCC 1007 / CBS 513.65 / DSM 816 / NCTC 3887 / NRRL 1 / QM 1276 / 107) TaxID=344612 RepID=A1CBZ6_ASPCL|nr:uncharacterized protein ACLA_017110 [Aspergillus clavatus NRRL 1]EAW13264.1 conserved hypothetical protein [Aspergillus clavatus NRRL 1]
MSFNQTSNPVYLGRILVGRAISPVLNGSLAPSQQWSIPPGFYTPQQLVHALSPLLDTVAHRLGPDAAYTTPARALLLDNIAATLSTGRRESALHFSPEILNASRREIMHQAQRIGARLLRWAHEYTSPPLPDLTLRQPSEGHPLLLQTAKLLLGCHSTPMLVDLFNEYIHQIVLLRDALLPFENFAEVIIPVPAGGVGLRHLEPARARFVAALFQKHVKHASVVAFARALLAPTLPATRTGGYGFQYPQGVVMPAVLAGSDALHLLRYVPGRVAPVDEVLLFDYAWDNSDAAPRVHVSGSPVDLMGFPQVMGRVGRAGLAVTRGSDAAIATLQLRLEVSDGDPGVVDVDVGQIARGHRYACRAQPSGVERALPATIHQPLDLLRQTGDLVTAAGGLHVIPVADRLVALALLGRVYPENVVLLPREGTLADADRSGKRLEPKFVIWGLQ